MKRTLSVGRACHNCSASFLTIGLVIAMSTIGRTADLKKLEGISSDFPEGVRVVPLTDRSPKFFSSNPQVFQSDEDIALLLKTYSRTDTPYPKVSQGYFAMLKMVNEFGLIGFRSSDATTRLSLSAALTKSFEKARISHLRVIEVGDCIVVLWSKDDIKEILDEIEELVRKRLKK